MPIVPPPAKVLPAGAQPPEFEDLVIAAIEQAEREGQLLPLSVNDKRMLFMRLQERRKKRGFAGREHENWPNSPDKRKEAALVLIREGLNGEQVRAIQSNHQNDLAMVDLIGRDETAGLLIDAFKDAAGIYFAAWDKTFDARWEDYRACLERIRQLIIAACRALWLGRLLPDPNPSCVTPAQEDMALWFDRLPLLDAEPLLDNEAAVRIYRARERELKRRAEAAGRRRQ